MDWVTLLSALGIGGVLQFVVSAIFNRKSNNADYAQKILEQAEIRVSQALDDRDRIIKERDYARDEAKGQRKSKQEWRDRFLKEQELHHETQLTLKDIEAKLVDEKWYRCELKCAKRKPPRENEV